MADCLLPFTLGSRVPLGRARLLHRHSQSKAKGLTLAEQGCVKQESQQSIAEEGLAEQGRGWHKQSKAASSKQEGHEATRRS